MKLRHILSLMAALALAASLLAGCGNSPKRAVSSEAIKIKVAAALTKADQIKTGTLQLNGAIANLGARYSNQDVKIDGGGPFDVSNPDTAEFDMKLTIATGGQQQQIGLASVIIKLYATIAARSFAIGEAKDNASNPLASGIDPKMFLGTLIKLNQYVSNAREVGKTTIDGQTVTSYAMDVDIAGFADNVLQQGMGLPKLPLPGFDYSNGADFKKRVKSSVVTIGIGDSDGLIHSGSLKAVMAGDTATTTGGTIDFSLVIEGLNKPVKIEVPENVIDSGGILDQLGSMLGGSGG